MWWVLPGGEEGSLEAHSCTKSVRYRECLKYHADSVGKIVTDGCGKFCPVGGEGSLEALRCFACGCHRNFHGKEIEVA